MQILLQDFIYTCGSSLKELDLPIVSGKIMKMENSLNINFGKICLYYSTGSLARFLSNFKNS